MFGPLLRKIRPLRGGARSGAGRPRGPNYKSSKPCRDCGLVVFATAKAPRCAPCKLRARYAREFWCPHPKPVFASGRERKVCYECSPKPLVKERKTYVMKSARTLQCQASGCSTSFVETGPRQKYCGDTCRIRSGNRLKTERSRDRSARQCKGCSLSFAPDYGDLKRVFCSADCALEFKKKSPERSGHTHKRRATRHGVEYKCFEPTLVLKRDGWRCRICGIDTPKELRGKFVHNAPELDHDVPLSRGGHHAPENTQCLCRSCNQMKSTRTTAEVLNWLAA